MKGHGVNRSQAETLCLKQSVMIAPEPAEAAMDMEMSARCNFPTPVEDAAQVSDSLTLCLEPYPSHRCFSSSHILHSLSRQLFAALSHPRLGLQYFKGKPGFRSIGQLRWTLKGGLVICPFRPSRPGHHRSEMACLPVAATRTRGTMRCWMCEDGHTELRPGQSCHRPWQHGTHRWASQAKH